MQDMNDSMMSNNRGGRTPNNTIFVVSKDNPVNINIPQDIVMA